jgi:F0F1-type ATP synthase beta subunit
MFISQISHRVPTHFGYKTTITPRTLSVALCQLTEEQEGKIVSLKNVSFIDADDYHPYGNHCATNGTGSIKYEPLKGLILWRIPSV